MRFIECNLCGPREGGPGRFESSPEVVRIRSNVRRFRDHYFTVWRCPVCRSLHCLEELDAEQLASYYENYPIQKQKLDWFARRITTRRLQILRRYGLRREQTILDYGCGTGSFVQFLREQGFQRTEGYDPYVAEFSDPSTLNKQFDFILTQDVIEHVAEPKDLIQKLLALLNTGGILATGTPDAGRMNLNAGRSLELAQCWWLHQPYHRHMIASAQLSRLLESQGLRVIDVTYDYYVDTPFPAVNSKFLSEYIHATGGFLDAAFEPFQTWQLARTPHLLVWLLFGFWKAPKRDVLVLAKK